MTWLRWFRRYEGRHEMPATTQARSAEGSDVTPSDATLRADRAAREAALRLQESRDRQPIVNDQVRKTLKVTRENGFAELIRNALGSGP